MQPHSAQDYIDAFQRGEDFASPARGVFLNGQPDPAALDVLGRQLPNAASRVRENIVHLLVEMGRQADPLTPKGADVLRDQHIVALLAGPGLAHHDLGREAAMDALRKLVLPAQLHQLGETLTRNLSMAPSDDAFLLVAKAKPEGARPVVEQIAGRSEWNGNEAARIARAAVGNTAIESQFLSRATDAEGKSDGAALSHELGTLGLIGTPRALHAVAARIRTPLTVEVPQAFVKSVRLSVLEALLYNFPDEPVLYPNNINADANYAAAEAFCIKTFGLKFTGERPPFLTYRGFPSPMPMPR